MTPDPPFVSPTFQPVAPSYPNPPEFGQPTPPYARRPRFGNLTFLAGRDGTDAEAPVTISVGEPTLVSVQRTSTVIGATEGASLELYWRASGEQTGGIPFAGPEEPARYPFLGPYAWLPQAGEYDIIGRSFTDGGARLAMVGEIVTGVTDTQWKAITSGPGSHYVKRARTVLGVGATAHLIDKDLFMRYREVLIQNSGANPGFIMIGSTGGGFSIAIPSQTNLLLGAELMGRGTLLGTSPLGTTFMTLAAMW